MAVSDSLSGAGIFPAVPEIAPEIAPVHAVFPPVRFGLATKIALWATLIVSITAGGIAFAMYRAAIDALVEREVSGLAATVNTAGLRLSARTEFARQDALFLSRTLPVAGIVRAQLNGGTDPIDGVSEAAWERRLAAIFSAMLESRPGYAGIRYVGMTEGGREIVRVQRSVEGVVRRTPVDQLQAISDRPFFYAASALADGEVYVSDFELTREYGEIVVPKRPVIRTATPVYDDAGIVRGEVVVSVSASAWFELLNETLAADEKLILANQQGDFLVHEDPDVAFGFEYGKHRLVQDEMPNLAGLFDGPDQSYSGFVGLNKTEDLAFAKRVYFDPGLRDRYVVVGAALDSNVLLGSIQAQRKSIAMIAILMIIGCVVLAILLSRAVVRPLRDLTKAAMQIAAGGQDSDIDIESAMQRRDETGVLARAFREMAIRIREREEEVEKKAEALARSNQELSQFAYVASHDLQEPLRMVGSYLGLLARRYRGKLDSEADEFIGYAVDGAERMKRLINDLLGYSRVSNRDMNLEAIDTGRLAGAVVRTLDERIVETGAEFTIEPLPEVHADAMQMERLFLNILENALKYRGEAPPRIRVAAERREDLWEFSVADNGIGIAPEFYEKIFEIFTRLHSRDKYQGTGIGLASCKRIVERHGGTIWVEPAPGGGSIFRFTLPAVPAIEENENAE